MSGSAAHGLLAWIWLTERKVQKFLNFLTDGKADGRWPCDCTHRRREGREGRARRQEAHRVLVVATAFGSGRSHGDETMTTEARGGCGGRRRSPKRAKLLLLLSPRSLQRRRRRHTHESAPVDVLARGRTGTRRRRTETGGASAFPEIQRSSERGNAGTDTIRRGEALDGERTLTGCCRSR